jgi:pimeloyl-ACP methyl ester carboxylesterase
MLLAATHADRLNGVVLNDIGPEVPPGGLARIMDYVGRVPDFDDYDDAARGLQAANAAAFPGVTLARWRLQAEFLWSQRPEGGLGLRYDPRLRDALTGPAATGAAPDLWQMFDHLARLPLAVIRGANSDLLNADTLARMQDRAPGMRAVTVPDRGHVPFLDEADSLAAIRWLLEAAR